MVTQQHTITSPRTLLDAAARCLRQSDPTKKCTGVAALFEARDGLRGECQAVLVGRPALPQLVDPRELPRRKLGSQLGHGAFVHAICHIEFTAINLALDAAVRFDGMPDDYYRDWISVAAEEAEHFSLLQCHLNSIGYVYGDFTAHDGLWDMAERTSGDVLRRMALVPRVMEARGLDVTPDMIVRLRSVGDLAGAAILEKILDDEIGHVAIGSRWFAWLCATRGLNQQDTFTEIVAAELGNVRTNRLNRSARLAAGFSESELDCLIAPHRG
ncbi:MAG: uncharacterized ferritin-like protein (DUF455 family) [Gammaproteobacteria bacterium]